MCLGELPLIFSLPVEQVLRLGPRLMQEGAQAISIDAPRGALSLTPTPSPAGRGGLTTGRLFGPSLFPQALDTVSNAAQLGIPIIGSGGIYSKENAEAMLSAGARAVQVDAALWNPAFQL
jgi:dihydroorotate dehydrogenase